jgi:hypothetical protein
MNAHNLSFRICSYMVVKAVFREKVLIALFSPVRTVARAWPGRNSCSMSIRGARGLRAGEYGRA